MLTLEELAATPAETNERPAEDRLSLEELANTPAEATSAWEQFRYGYDKEKGMTAYGADILESYFPLGKITFDTTNGFQYVPASGAWSEDKDFMAATPEQRREMIFQDHAAFLEKKYGEDFEPDLNSGASIAGQIAGAAADITSILPAGATLKGAAGIGGAMGASYSGLQDVAFNQPIDLEKAAIVGGASAVAAPAIMAGARAVSSRLSDRAANKLVDRAQKAVDEKVAQGYEVRELPSLLEEQGINLAKLADAQGKLNRKIKIPPKASPADIAVGNAIAKDSTTSRLYSPGLDKLLGTLSTRIRNISEPVFGRLRKFEFNTRVNTFNKSKQIEPFLQKFNGLNKQDRAIIGRNLYNGNFAAVEAYMRRLSPELADDFSSVRGMLDELADELSSAGHSFTKLENYFPRKVVDVNGLLNSLGKEQKSQIQKAIEQYAKSKNTTATQLDPDEKAEIIDLVIRGYKVTVDNGKPSFAKPRKIEAISDEQMKFYASPEESLSNYIRTAVNDIEKRKFFGRATQESGGRFDSESSIGRFIQDEIDAGNISSDKQDELADMLRARFISGETSGNEVVKGVRSLGYMGTIANPITALVQLGDTGVSAALNGFRNTFKSLFGQKDAKLIDLGMDNIITEELSDPGKMAKVLRGALKYGGFNRLDRLGKETFITAALKRSKQLVNTDKGIETLRKKWGNVFGDEFDLLVSDLQSGSMTDNVKLMLFNELSDIQPISLSEMPQMYLENPNGRIFYMLKSFTLRQYDIARRNIVQEYKKGNKAAALRNATVLAGYMTAANVSTGVIKDLMLGRDVRPEDFPDKSMWALLGVYGVSKYTGERYLARGDIGGAVLNLFTPATPIIDAAFTLGSEAFKDDPNYEKTTRAIPVVGPLIYSWFGGGAERYNDRLDD